MLKIILERSAYIMNKYSLNITKNLNLKHVAVNATTNIDSKMKTYENYIHMKK